MHLKRLALVAITVVLATSLVFIAGCGEDTKEEKGEMEKDETAQNGEIVATVNDEEIMREELNQLIDQNMEMTEMEMKMGGKELGEEEREEMRAEIKPQALEQLIEDVLLNQEAEAMGIYVDNEEIEKEIESVMQAQGMDEEMLEEQIEQQGITMEELEDDIEQYLLLEKLVKEKVGEEEFEVGEKELKEMYEQQEKQMEMAEEKGMPAGEELEDFEEMKDDLKEMAAQQVLQENIGQVFEELKEDAKIEKFI